MAHNLNIAANGEAALYLLKEKAWHGLGQVVEEAKSSEEVIQIAHLDWDVIKSPNYVKVGDEFVKTGSLSTMRADNNTILGNRLTDRYTIMQNAEAFKFMDSLVVNNHDITYETAGALGQGEVTFVTAKLPNYLRIGTSNDVIEKFLIMANSHDGSTPLSIFLSDVRIVCNNTLSAAMRSFSNRIILRHTHSISDRLEEGRKLLDMTLAYNEELQKVLNHLAEVKVTEQYAKDFINGLFLNKAEMEMLAKGELSTRKQTTLNEISESFITAPGQDLHQGSALHLYNGVTSYFQNVKTYQSDDRKMQGINLGGYESAVSQTAFNTLLQLA
jgi:phage/plasmid-like protein (TIGR03299 family)